ncbi:LPXTG cell wall anchor domain-containing protein [Enterococcus faecium]|uniref:LPXTG cell wall anchor domain-containing protein n=1 Tax=Enterococcus faecium TaxID=1352 RepID=UPI0009C17BCF|nr:LPXTG cell wall anchor domain-containing protein [Enterococcus faecium]EME8099629.1 LPXTG cell wall anchor domain-containing protein [Enterococcus faecium]OQO64483.1 hypothetical protein BH743_12070 [Enterococcus faecium]
MRNVQKIRFIILLILLFTFSPSISYASQNNSRTEDYQKITFEIIDKEVESKEETTKVLPSTGEQVMKGSFIGVIIVGSLIALYLYKKRENGKYE